MFHSKCYPGTNAECKNNPRPSSKAVQQEAIETLETIFPLVFNGRFWSVLSRMATPLHLDKPVALVTDPKEFTGRTHQITQRVKGKVHGTSGQLRR